MLLGQEVIGDNACQLYRLAIEEEWGEFCLPCGFDGRRLQQRMARDGPRSNDIALLVYRDLHRHGSRCMRDLCEPRIDWLGQGEGFAVKHAIAAVAYARRRPSFH